MLSENVPNKITVKQGIAIHEILIRKIWYRFSSTENPEMIRKQAGFGIDHRPNIKVRFAVRNALYSELQKHGIFRYLHYCLIAKWYFILVNCFHRSLLGLKLSFIALNYSS